MSFANVILYIALIAYVLYGKARGWPMKPPKKLFALPIVIVVIGYGDATQGTIKPFEIALIAIGSVISLVLGLMRGQADKISIRNGGQYVQWGAMSFGLFAANLVAKVILDAVGVAAGMSFSTVGKSLVFTLGLTLVGEAIVLFVRSGGATDLLNNSGNGATQSGQPRRDNRANSGTHFSDSAYRDDTIRPTTLFAADASESPRRSWPNLRGDALDWVREHVDQPAPDAHYGRPGDTPERW